MKVCVLGLGRVGLPLALFLAERGFEVAGVDVDLKKIERLEKGEMPFEEEGAGLLLKKHLGKKFKINLSKKEAYSQDFLILTVGTPIDHNFNPVLKDVDRVIDEILPYLKKSQTIILRSTLAPGTTERISKMIEKKTKFKIGKDLFLAFCPERIAEGKSLQELSEIPQIIGSLDSKSGRMAESFFSKFTKLNLLSDAKSVELAKLFTNMYRYIGFAIANEFMVIAQAHKRDIHEIVKLVNEGYKRGGLKSPGFSAGPCLYKDGFFLLEGEPFVELINSSWKINEGMPGYLIKRLKKVKNLEGTKVALLGLGFKADTDDTRNSLSFKTKKIFELHGSEVEIHDPFIKTKKLEKVLKEAEVIFISTNHSAYKNLTLDFLKKYAKKKCVVVDMWNLLKTDKIIFSLF